MRPRLPKRRIVYQRHRPETTALYEVVRDNFETLYGAINDGVLDIPVPKHAKKELEAYLDCGPLCRGFARLRCESCDESRPVASSRNAWSLPSCIGRRMCATAAEVIERTLPEVDLRQWVLTALIDDASIDQTDAHSLSRPITPARRRRQGPWPESRRRRPPLDAVEYRHTISLPR